MYVAFHDTGISAGQAETDVSEAARDLLAAVDRLHRFYDSVTCWQVMKESASALAERMLAEAPAAMQREQTWTASVGDIEVWLYPRVDRSAKHAPRPRMAFSRTAP